MSSEHEDDESPEQEKRTPYSTTLAHLGKTMRVYGNTILVLMIVMFFTSIFLFLIVYNPVASALIIIYILKAFEFGFYIDFLVALKKSETTYGGHLLFKGFILLLSMMLLNVLILGVGTIVVALKVEDLLIIYSEDGPAEKIFFFYTMLSAQASWLKFIEIIPPVLTIIGTVLLYKWGNIYIGDRLEEEITAPFPKEMKMMINGGSVILMGIIFGIIIGYIPETISSSFTFVSGLRFMISLLQIIGTIIIAVGFSRAGYYLELYTTKDKEKFFSSKIYEE